MAKPFRLLPQVMDTRAREVLTGSALVVKKAAESVDESLVRGTPVDKGVARSNWIASVDRASQAYIPAYAPGRKLGIGEGANATAAIAQAKGAISRYSEKNKAIYIVNNTPYIVRLNAGYSRQAPAAFVQRAIQGGIASIKGMRLLK